MRATTPSTTTASAARPSNVGPHDPNKDQHDPDAPKRTPEDAYAAEVGGQAGRRSLAETAVGRYKAIIGPKLRARTLPAQQGETAIAVQVLNRMIRAAKPISVRVA